MSGDDNGRIRELVAQAVGRRFDEWAAEHPSLAAVIDRVTLTDRAAESLRATDGYRKAVAGYYRARSEQELLADLTGLAGDVLTTILR